VEMRATVLALLLCGACGHVSNNAAAAMTVVTVAAAIQVLAPPALEGRTGICSESREIRCVTTALCAHDERRGCDFAGARRSCADRWSLLRAERRPPVTSRSISSCRPRRGCRGA